MSGFEEFIGVREEFVAECEREISALQHRIEIAQAEIRAFKEARQIMLSHGIEDVEFNPEFGAKQDRNESSPRKAGRGRMKGSMSMRWRRILAQLRSQHGKFYIEHVIDAVYQYDGKTIKPSEVRRLFDTHIENGYLTTNGDGCYCVTEKALHKFPGTFRAARGYLEEASGQNPLVHSPDASHFSGAETVAKTPSAPDSRGYATDQHDGAYPYSKTPNDR